MLASGDIWRASYNAMGGRGDRALSLPRTSGGEAIIDWSQIDGLIEVAGVTGVREILDAFWRSTEELSAALKSQIAAGDFAAAARTAHAIKGSSANVGAQMLADAAREIEVYAKSNELKAPEAALATLSRIYGETRAALEARLTETR